MNNPNKHKPLSPEELFKLLDNTSNKASDFDELDDFEREALEGFSAHSDSKRAQALTEELNIAISQKASGTETKDGKKNKVIWFSAAASIVVVIMISVFFFNKSKEESQTNIVLNEAKEDKQPVVSEVGTVPPLETISENTVREEVTETKNKEKFTSTLSATQGPKSGEGESVAGMVNEPAFGYSESKPSLSPSVIGSKDEAKKREDDYDALQKQAEVLADKMTANEKSKTAKLEQEIAPGDAVVLSNQVAANNNAERVTTMDAKVAKEESNYYKADREKTASTKKSPDKQNAAKEQAAMDIELANAGSAKSTTAPAQGSTADNNLKSGSATSGKNLGNNLGNNSAYYTGSELAIRDAVLDYFKDKSLAAPVGKYKVKGTVDAKGKLKVSSVTKISQEDCKCMENIERALNTMKKWNSANQDGKDVSSNVEFTLAF